MQLAIDFAPAPVTAVDDSYALDSEDACPCCGTDWFFGDDGTIYGCDILAGGTEQFLTWRPCCLDIADEVAAWGFEETYGVSVERVVALIGGYDVLEVLGHGDGCIIARLKVRNPTIVLEDTDRCGNRKAKSPAGWQSEILADVAAHHSHHAAPNGWKFGLAAYNGSTKVGVMVVAPPISRALMQAQPQTAEVVRGCVLPARRELTKNTASKLYAAACAQARQLGYDRVVTYTLANEGGHSLLASGWTKTGSSAGGEWGRPSRARTAKHEKTDTSARKVRWEKGLTKKTRRLVREAGEAFEAAIAKNDN